MARLRRLAALCTVPAAALLLSGCAPRRTEATTLIVGEKPGHVRATDEPARAVSLFVVTWGSPSAESPLRRYATPLKKSNDASRSARALFDRAVELAEQGRNVEAEQALAKAAEMDPLYKYAYDNWLAALVETRRYVEAREKAERAANLEPPVGAARVPHKISSGK